MPYFSGLVMLKRLGWDLEFLDCARKNAPLTRCLGCCCCCCCCWCWIICCCLGNGGFWRIGTAFAPNRWCRCWCCKWAGIEGRLCIDCIMARFLAAYWGDRTTSLYISMTMCVNGRNCSLVLQYSEITCKRTRFSLIKDSGFIDSPIIVLNAQQEDGQFSKTCMKRFYSNHLLSTFKVN